MTTADPRGGGGAPHANGRAGGGASAPAAAPPHPDSVVAELDLVLCQPDPAAEVILTRFPLVGRDRPPAPCLAPLAARMKAGARKLEFDVPAAGAGGAGGEETGESVPLAGALADAGGRLLLAARRGGRVYLVPVASTACLTPRAAVADDGRRDGRRAADAAAAAAAASTPPADDGVSAPPPPALTPLTVRVNRRETERQQEARESSYAHLADAEAREPWRVLRVASGASAGAAAALDALLAGGDAGAPTAAGQFNVAPADYLAVLAPPAPPSDYAEPPPPPPDGDPASAPAPALPTPAPPPSAALASLPPGAVDAVRAALTSAWRASLVVALDALRAELRRAPPPAGDAVAAAAAAAAPDALLRAAADAAGAVCVRGAYVPPSPGGLTPPAGGGGGGGGVADAVHGVVVALLQARPSFRRADLAAALAAAGVDNAPDAVVTRLVKGLCRARGNLWCLRDE